MLPADHPLAAEPVITPAHLDDVPSISLYADHFLHEAIERAFAERSARLRMAVHVEFFGTACALVMEGVGVTIVDVITSLHFRKFGLVARPVAPNLAYRYAMFQPAPRPLSRIAREFVEAFHEHNAELIREHSPYDH